MTAYELEEMRDSLMDELAKCEDDERMEELDEQIQSIDDELDSRDPLDDWD